MSDNPLRDYSRLTPQQLRREIEAMQSEESRRLNHAKDECIAEVKAILERYKARGLDPAILSRLIFQQYEEEEGLRRHIHKQSTGDINIHANYNIGRDAQQRSLEAESEQEEES